MARLFYNQMVVDQLGTQLRDEEIDRLFQAFADTTRRDIVRRVTVGEYSVSGLAALYAMSFAAVQKHVAVLERASLVAKEKRGREQIVRANHDGLQKARRLLDEYEVIWRQRADRIADLLAETAPAGPGRTQAGNTKTSKTETGKSKDRKDLS
jgi:DNA-binding transcriptional ArsR family regulator